MTDAWTFQAGSAREQLRSCKPLLERMASLMQVQPSLAFRNNNHKELAEAKKSVAGEGETDDEGDREQQESGRGEGCCEREGGKARVLEGVLAALPTFSKRYGLGRAGMYASYVNDELGSAFRHSERPNCQVRLACRCFYACLVGLVLFAMMMAVVVGGCSGPFGNIDWKQERRQSRSTRRSCGAENSQLNVGACLRLQRKAKS